MPLLTWRLVQASAVLFVLAAVAAIILDKPRTFIVTLTKSGFVPQSLVIAKGDTVTFRATGEKKFWPASNTHPTHTLYASFDAKHALSPNEEWSFTFDRVGAWPYHDHLFSAFKGTIIVQGYPGEARIQCRSKIGESSDIAPACWESEIVDALKRGGIEEAFEAFDELYKSQPGFQRQCHDVSHVLGSEAYALFSNDHETIDKPETAYCGYGFYHGFIEAMLVDQGPSDYESSRQYCETLRQKSGETIAGPCFHGIGHAVFDSLDGSLWGNAWDMAESGIATCEKVVENETDRVQCSTGIFNALGNAISARNYDLSPEGVDIIALCKAQKRAYQDGCIVQAGIGHIRFKQMDRQTALRFVESLGPELAPAGFWTYIDNEVLNSIATFDAKEYHDTCVALKNPVYRQYCVRGVISGLHNLGDPHEEYKPMFGFCDLFSKGELRSFCYEAAVRETRAINEDNPEYPKACAQIKDVDRSLSCR